MDQPSSGTLLSQVDPVRAWVISMLGVIVSVGSFGFALLAVLAPGSAAPPERAYLGGLLVQGIVALAAAILARLRSRAWGARLLAADLILMPSFTVITFGLPHVIAIAAYVGAILAISIGTRPAEVVLVTVCVLILGLVAATSDPPGQYAVQTLVSTAGLLVVTGATLAWLLDALRGAISGLEASEAHFHRLSHVDPLTGLGNRREFEESLAELMGPVSRSTALVVLDVDHLKKINDRYGHPVGDEALRTVARAIQGSIRDRDIATRIGGDEFAVILSSGGQRGAQQIASRIQERLDALLSMQDDSFHCTISIGLSEKANPHQTPDELLATADAELYAHREHVRKPVPPL